MYIRKKGVENAGYAAKVADLPTSHARRGTTFLFGASNVRAFSVFAQRPNARDAELNFNDAAISFSLSLSRSFVCFGDPELVAGFRFAASKAAASRANVAVRLILQGVGLLAPSHRILTVDPALAKYNSNPPMHLHVQFRARNETES